MTAAVATQSRIYKKKKKKVADWRAYSPPYTVGKDEFHYCNVKYDYDGWADAYQFRPYPYDLVNIKTDLHYRTGWWNGSSWEGLRLKEEEKVLYWKNVRHETFSQI